MKKFYLMALLIAGFMTSHAQMRHYHIYTFIEELGSGKDGYFNEGIQCYVFKEPQQNTIPIFRYYDGHEHFYTPNSQELSRPGGGGFWFEEVQFYAYLAQMPGTIPLYRVNGPNGHSYTTDINETSRHGNHMENVMCFVYPTQVDGTAPLYGYVYGGNRY